MIPKYKYITKILENTKMSNPALFCALYQIDETTLQDLKSILLTIRKHHLNDVEMWIEETKDFITGDKHKKLLF